MFSIQSINMAIVYSCHGWHFHCSSDAEPLTGAGKKQCCEEEKEQKDSFWCIFKFLRIPVLDFGAPAQNI